MHPDEIVLRGSKPSKPLQVNSVHRTNKQSQNDQSRDPTAVGFCLSTAMDDYDVFLNHRGPDVKGCFIAHLHDALRSEGLNPFLDKKSLLKGDLAFESIDAALEVARVHVAVVSEGYAESKHCLSELAAMMRSGKPVIPVFYDVEPAELRGVENGSFASAFEKHKSRETSEQVAEWADALGKLADITGFCFHSADYKGDEAELKQEVVDAILSLMPTHEDVQFDQHLMAGSGSDLVNASLGAAFGGLFGPVVDTVIDGLKFVSHCREQCNGLREELKKIKPLLGKISDEYKGDPAVKSWLDALEDCVKEAEEVLKTCTSDNSGICNRVREVRYGTKILKLKERISVNINLAPMVLLRLQSGSSSKSSMGTCGIMQQVPPKILGMKDHFERVKTLILEGHKREGSSCIGIRGMGGAGKTLLAQMVNNDEEIQHVFGKESVIWITVGRDAEIPVIYGRMSKRLDVCSDGGSLEDQRTELLNAFLKRKVLLILDDVWDGISHKCVEMVDWWNIATGPGSVTLLTTRDESVIRKCVNAGEEIIFRLSEEQSWELFCTHAFDTYTTKLNKDLEGVPMDVCKECKCLPLALKVIGRAMKGKSSIGEWRKALRLLRASSTIDKGVEQQLFERLRFSYDILDGPTKICFLYFAGFPEDCEIPVERLCQIWIAEGLFGQDLDAERALDAAQDAVKELVRRSLIEECSLADSEDPRVVKMHDILRDLAIRMTREGVECERESLFEVEKKGLKEFPSTWLRSKMKVKRLSLWGNEMKRFPHNFKAVALKTCMLYPHPWKYPNGRVGSSFQACEVGEDFFYNIPNLKFLQICANSSILLLPESMGGLRSLQYLDLSWCNSLRQLPESMGGLRSLQHLNLSWCGALQQLPESMGELESLQHLNLKRCGALQQLPENMEGLGSLQHLNLSWCKALQQLPESIGELGSLQYLDLRGCGALQQLPKSMGGLGSLQHLSLSWCEALQQLPESMGGLGSLQHLDLSWCKALQQLPESMGGLGSLQHLDLSWCKALQQLPESMGGLGSLQHFDLSWCKALQQLPESMGALGSLQYLNLSGFGACIWNLS